MVAIRWVTGLLLVEALVCLFFTERGVLSSVIAAAFLLLFLIFCGTFRRSTISRKASS